MTTSMRKIQVFLVSGYFFLLGGCAAVQRKFLFFPTHHERTNGLAAWNNKGRFIGYAREVPAPENVWLMLHGNAGQAADRVFALPCFSTRDAVFILEYPGYGARPGQPSKGAFETAAEEAYRILRAKFPSTPVCVVGESLGSGPASRLAKQPRPPDKIALVVPFDHLALVAARHVAWLPVKTILGPTWDNVDALAGYRGPVEIFGAVDDTVIPIEHARNLAAKVPGAKFHELAGAHNGWAATGAVAFRNP
jgi:uncharacterized protein